MEQFLNEILKGLVERQEHYKTNLAKGSAQSFEDYRETIGVIRGLSEAAFVTEKALNKIRNQ